MLRLDWKLRELGMEAGDELYFRAVVEDNRQPEPNRARTPMLMLRWPAEDEEPGLAIEGIAVDLLPEYFRSQRQIIIDTKRLIEEAGEIDVAEGTDRSRALAFDQKALRLRYGQFLGEEYSSDTGPMPAPAATPGEEHAGESFQQHQEHAHGGNHEARDHAAQPAAAGSPDLPAFMADFVHSHDYAEQATLFDDKTRATLKAALAAMWDAELELHLSRPEAALPHEYRALRLIKEVQQANRIYVRRLGFEPPALDFDRRLTGELDEAHGFQRHEAVPTEDQPPAPAALLRREPGDAGFREALEAWLEQLSGREDSVDLRLDLTRLLAGEACPACLERIRLAAWKSLGEPEPAASRPLGPAGFGSPTTDDERSGGGRE